MNTNQLNNRNITTLTGAERVLLERYDQINKHGFDEHHDSGYNHQNGELAIAAKFALTLVDWPENWNKDYAKKIEAKPYRERVIIAAAFLSAEYDRLNKTPAVTEITKLIHDLLFTEYLRDHDPDNKPAPLLIAKIGNILHPGASVNYYRGPESEPELALVHSVLDKDKCIINLLVPETTENSTYASWRSAKNVHHGDDVKAGTDTDYYRHIEIFTE